MIPDGAVCGCGRVDWLFCFVHWCEIKGILEKKAAPVKLSCPGKCYMEKLIVRGVGIPGFPTDSAFPALAKLPSLSCLERETDVN